MELTNSFEILLRTFSPVFTDPSFQTFRLLMTGWILSVRHRYVTDLIISSDSVGHGHFSDYHRFFSQAVWDIDHLWKLLATLIVNSLIGKDGTIVLAGDDTLCRKRGLGIFGTGMHHDPEKASPGSGLVFGFREKGFARVRLGFLRVIGSRVVTIWTGEPLSSLSEKFGLPHRDSSSNLIRRARKRSDQSKDYRKSIADIEWNLGLKTEYQI